MQICFPVKKSNFPLGYSLRRFCLLILYRLLSIPDTSAVFFLFFPSLSLASSFLSPPLLSIAVGKSSMRQAPDLWLLTLAALLQGE